jgi:hypothetical protein
MLLILSSSILSHWDPFLNPFELNFSSTDLSYSRYTILSLLPTTVSQNCQKDKEVEDQGE